MSAWYEMLHCPVCASAFEPPAGSLVCASGHCFDIARQGYVNLLSGGAEAGTADTRDMVESRRRFFASGHYRSLIERVAAVTAGAIPGVSGCVVDAGAGTGDYLAAVLQAAPGRVGLALDLSKYAARYATKAHPDIGAVVCDVWGRLPVRSSVAAAVMSVFAPRNAAESARVLAPGGALVVVTPTTNHLRELVGPLGMLTVDPDKGARLERTVGAVFMRERVELCEYRVVLSAEEMISLALMGPSAWHASAQSVRAAAEAIGGGVDATVSAEIGVWRVRRPQCAGGEV